MLSMIHQMLIEERVESVRAAILMALAVLICFIEDEDKFSQVSYLLLT